MTASVEPLDGVNDPWQWCPSWAGWVRAWHVTWEAGAFLNGEALPDLLDMRYGPDPVTNQMLPRTTPPYAYLLNPGDGDPALSSDYIRGGSGTGWHASPNSADNGAYVIAMDSAPLAEAGSGVFFWVTQEEGFTQTTVPHPDLDPTLVLSTGGFTVGEPYVWDASAPSMFLRHASRHVHHTVANHIKNGLTQLDWLDPANTPLGAPVVTIQTEPVITSGRAATKVQAGLVSITLGNEARPDRQEMGGPLTSQEYPIFIDVFGNTDGETTALACDIRDILLARFEFASRFLPVVDQATGTPVDGWVIELEDVERGRPDNTFAVYWQVVKVTATAYFGEMSY